jgi:hypothetical protein
MNFKSVIVILLVFSFVLVTYPKIELKAQGSAFAQSISKPSAPDFTTKIVADTIEVKIKNQPLGPYENGSYPRLYYMFRFKDHDAIIGFWNYDPVYFVLPSTYGGYHEASDSDFTLVSISLEGHDFPSGQIDIQAIALVGNQYPTNMQNGTVYGFEGEISSWSNTQTLIIDENPLLWLVIVLVVVVVIIVGLSGYFKKRKR